MAMAPMRQPTAQAPSASYAELPVTHDAQVAMAARGWGLGWETSTRRKALGPSQLATRSATAERAPGHHPLPTQHTCDAQARNRARVLGHDGGGGGVTTPAQGQQQPGDSAAAAGI